MSKRRNIFLLFCAALVLVIFFKLLYLAGPGGAAYRAEALKISHKTGELAAIRGRIFDSNGELIVWSERSYDLFFNARKLPLDRRKMLNKVLRSTLIAGLPLQLPQHSGVLKYNLTADELATADELSSLYPEFSVELRWERISLHPPPQLGEVRQQDGMEHGISGWEQKYESKLRGQPGAFSVMLDRRGRWINPTFRIIKPPVPGQDIYLNPMELNKK